MKHKMSYTNDLAQEAQSVADTGENRTLKTIQTLTGGFADKTRVVKDKNRKGLTKENNQLRHWKNCSTKYGKGRSSWSMEERCHPFSTTDRQLFLMWKLKRHQTSITISVQRLRQAINRMMKDMYSLQYFSSTDSDRIEGFSSSV